MSLSIDAFASGENRPNARPSDDGRDDEHAETTAFDGELSETRRDDGRSADTTASDGNTASTTRRFDDSDLDGKHSDAMKAPPGDAPPPLPATVLVLPWDDPLVERHGHDPRSAYVEQFWLSVLGPTATWLLRRLVAGFDDAPEGYQLDVAHTARSLGLSVAKGLASPFSKAVQRCVMFGVAGQRSDAWVVRRRVPAISQRHLLRLPEDLQQRHQEWMAATVTLDALQRAHVIAAAMLDAGDDPALLEPQLVAVGVPRRAALEARELVLRRAS